MKKAIALTICFLLCVSSFSLIVSGDSVLELLPDSLLRFSDDRAYIMGIVGTPDVSEIVSAFARPESVTVTSPDGVERTGRVASDDIVSCGGDFAKILIYGDVDRNGNINARDVILTMKYICGPAIDVCDAATDVNEDSRTNAVDVIMIMKYLVGCEVDLGNIVYPSREFKIDSSYRIVLPDDADDTEEEAAQLLATALDSLYSTSMGQRWIIYDTAAAEKEIIVGDTNRTETKKQLNRLSSDGYLYNIIEPGKIVVAGSDPEGTYEAVQRFLWDNYGYIDKYNTIHSAKVWNGETYVDIKGSTTLTSSRSFYYQYPGNKVLLTINETPIEDFTLVPRDEHFIACAEILNRSIRLLTGQTLVSDPDYSGENAIYIGRNADGGNYSSLGHIYNIGADGSSIYIDAYRQNVTRFAVRAFSHKYLSSDHQSAVDIGIEGNTIGIYNSNLLELTSSTSSELAEGITYREMSYTDFHSLPVEAFAVEIKSGAGTLKLGTPNGETSFSGVSATTTAEMKTLMNTGEDVIAGINGDFFDLGGTSAPLGLCVKDGGVMQQANGRPWFAVLGDGSFRLGSGNDSRKLLDQMVTAIGGSHILLKNGNPYELGQDSDFGGIRHPRSAIGYNEDGDIILLVVDGRRANYSNGASLSDLSLILKQLGATYALNLDGGGSSTLATVEDGSVTIKNSPSDIFERAVYDSLVVVK